MTGSIPRAATNGVKPWRVLVVDDDAMVAATLGEALTRHHAIVTTANHGLAALRLLEDWRNQRRELPDLLITDLRMPEMTGVELIEALHARKFALSGIVAMSAEGGRDDLLALMRLGVTEFLEKPFSQKRLFEQIDRARKHSDRALASLTEENQQLRERLHRWEAKESLGRVTRGILHDVHNCLAIITGSAEMIKMALEQGQAQGSKPVDRYADSITEITSRAVETLHQLQALNRMGEGVFTVFDLRRLIAGTHELLRNALDSKVEISLGLGQDALFVQGDAVVLQNAWIRLFFTLCDAMPKDKSGIHVGGTLRPQGGDSEGSTPLEGDVVLTLLAPGARLDAAVMAKQSEIWQSQGARFSIVEDAHGAALQLHWQAAALPSEWSRAEWSPTVMAN